MLAKPPLFFGIGVSQYRTNMNVGVGKIRPDLQTFVRLVTECSWGTHSSRMMLIILYITAYDMYELVPAKAEAYE